MSHHPTTGRQPDAPTVRAPAVSIARVFATLALARPILGAPVCAALLTLGLAAGVGPVPAAAQETGAASVPDVLILQPRAGETVFGEVEVVAEVLSAEEIARVVFRLDGREVGRDATPPFRVVVDVGQDNVAHEFEVVAVTTAGVEGSAVRTTPPITVDEQLDLELQQLYVTVTRDDERVLQLPRRDFRILDNGMPQDIVTFEPGDVPLTAALLVDASASMAGDRLQMAVRGARRFVEEMKDLDEATLLLFSDRLLYSTPFTDDPELLTAALTEVTAGGGTAINDHLYLALKWLEARQGRRVVVLLTDGIDVESGLDMEQVLWMVGRSQALVYWIRVLEEDTDLARFTSWRDATGHRRELQLLAQAVQESGGRIVDIHDLQQAESVFREILRELREQYVLGYYPSDNSNDGSWHEVEVRVRGPYSVRTREGYIDF